jgi:hypothetical protein
VLNVDMPAQRSAAQRAMSRSIPSTAMRLPPAAQTAKKARCARHADQRPALWGSALR